MTYFIGSLETLQQFFPAYDWEHARKSLDGGQAVIEKEITAELEAQLTAENVFIFTYEQALDFLNDPVQAGVWFE